MVNGHNMSPEEQKEYYGSKYASRNWDSLSPEAQEAGRELWDLLYHHYSLAEFYDDLEAHPWSVANMSDKLDSIIKYNGPEFQNLYLDYRVWVESLVPGSVDGDDIVKPERPVDEVYEEEEEDDA